MRSKQKPLLRTGESPSDASAAIFNDLRDQVVLITGGANGIGAATVRAFHAQQSQIFFCDTDESAGKKLASQLGEKVRFDRVDLTKEYQICRWINSIAKERKRINVLVNNAAIDPRIALGAATVAEWDHLFACNVRSYFLTSREAVKVMSEGGSIINFASITFHTGPSLMSAYVATKGGIIGFTRSLARELGPRKIRVNILSPGWIMTERQLRQYVTPPVKKLIRNSQCIPDLIQPEDIAKVVLFLASKCSSAITGQEILADRGWTYS